MKRPDRYRRKEKSCSSSSTVDPGPQHDCYDFSLILRLENTAGPRSVSFWTRPVKLIYSVLRMVGFSLPMPVTCNPKLRMGIFLVAAVLYGLTALQGAGARAVAVRDSLVGVPHSQRQAAKDLLQAAELQSDAVLAARAAWLSYERAHFRLSREALLYWQTLEPHDYRIDNLVTWVRFPSPAPAALAVPVRLRP